MARLYLRTLPAYSGCLPLIYSCNTVHYIPLAMIGLVTTTCLMVISIYAAADGYSMRSVKCPIPSICIWGCNYDRRHMSCSESMLGPYSPELPSDPREDEENVWAADFSVNDISIIQNLSFYTAHYEVIRLHSLNYSTNKIHTIEPTAFSGLEYYLHTLILDNNLLEVIPADTVQNLTKLRFLSVNNNLLTSIDFICMNSLPRLHKLSVGNNMISEVSPSCFYGTRLGKTKESSLIIRGNRLRYLSACTFQGREFQQLDYANNSYICMCEMAWLNRYHIAGAGSGENDKEQIECQLAAGNGTMNMSIFSANDCPSTNDEEIQCVDMIVKATYRRETVNQSEVEIHWSSKDFPRLEHFHATLYSFKDGVSTKVGRYKLHNIDAEFGYSIMLPEDSGQDLVVCVEALTKGNSSSLKAPTTATNKMPPVHMQCKQVKIPEEPNLSLGAYTSSTPNYKLAYGLALYGIACILTCNFLLH